MPARPRPPHRLDLEEPLPGRCFISHSYKDSAAVKKLCGMLGDRVEPVIFPPRREPNPSAAVSDSIIPTILGCPGLIYLSDGASAKSFWVSFERDFALRSNRQVFSYSARGRRVRRDRSAPVPLDVTIAFHRSDEERVDRLLSWMATERNFKIEQRRLRSTFGGFTGDIMVVMEELLRDGGVLLWLVGNGNQAIARSFHDPDFLDYLRQYGRTDFDELLDEDGNPYDRVHEVFARIDPDLSPDWTPGAVGDSRAALLDLYDGQQGDAFNWNRIDDLIIRLYEQVHAKLAE